MKLNVPGLSATVWHPLDIKLLANNYKETYYVHNLFGLSPQGNILGS